MLDQVEERRLTPVEVVEEDDERALRGGLLEELANRPRDLLRGRRRLGLAEERGDRVRRLERGRGRAAELLHDLDHRPVRDPLAVGETAALDDPRVDAREELPRRAATCRRRRCREA